MLAKDSVKSRISSEAGISYTEFTYQLLQGYDYVHLAEQHGCRVQVRPWLAAMQDAVQVVRLVGMYVAVWQGC